MDACVGGWTGNIIDGRGTDGTSADASSCGGGCAGASGRIVARNCVQAEVDGALFDSSSSTAVDTEDVCSSP
jgi:hypothetical protein